MAVRHLENQTTPSSVRGAHVPRVRLPGPPLRGRRHPGVYAGVHFGSTDTENPVEAKERRRYDTKPIRDEPHYRRAVHRA